MTERTGRTTMAALIQQRYGSADVLTLEQVPIPQPGPRQVRIRVHAAALNPADVFQLHGKPAVMRLGFGLSRPKKPVRGSDVAGEVVAVGSDMTGVDIGDRVFGGAATGSLAEYACLSATGMAPIPDGVTATDAAASVMAALAAHDGLVAGRIPAVGATGKRVLIIGAAGGIGSFAVQMAKTAGAHVTGVCSTRNVDTVKALGADAVVDYTHQDVTQLAPGYDLVFDNVGAVPMAALHELTTPTGVVIPNSGLEGPDGGAVLRVVKATTRRLLLRKRYRTYLSTLSAPTLRIIAAQLANGTLTPLIDSALPLERGAEAMTRVASGHARGKVVVTP